MHDIVIIGGGPAGMTAALYALRFNRSVLVLEKNGFGGQIAYSPKVENYPGTATMSGSEFADRLLGQIMDMGAEVEIAAVTGIRDDGRIKTVLTEEGCAYEGKSVIIAAGARHRMLGIPGERGLGGSGISYCAVCDGDFYRGKHVAMVGGGNTALQEALLLSDICSRVTVIQNLDCFTGEQKLVDELLKRENVRAVLGSIVTGFSSDNGELNGITLRGASCGMPGAQAAPGRDETLAVDGLFVAIGLAPDNEAFRSVTDLDGAGYIIAGEQCLTRTPGIFAAGDCRTKTVRQLTTACADGAAAAIAACRA
jgi:thioredoxin reductase (NADPH)